MTHTTIDLAQLDLVHGAADTGAAPQVAAAPQTSAAPKGSWVMNQLQKSLTTLAATPPTHSLWMIDPSDFKH